MSLKQLVFFLLAAAIASAGCASGGQSTSGDQEAEEVSASPPSADEDTRGELPRGPEIDRDRPSQAQSADGEDTVDTEGQAITRAELDSFIDKGPSFALTQVEVEPSRSGGTFEGFKIVAMREGARRTVSEQLEVGDVITHVNGVRLEKPDDYLDAWKLLDEVTRIRIDFLRGGESQHAIWRVE